MQQKAVSMDALRNHMQADMMHDALRADVLAAMLAGSQQQTGQKASISGALDEHIKSFNEALAENERLPLNGEIKQALGKVRPALDAYVKDSQLAVKTAFDAPAQAPARLQGFLESFRALEQEMAALSELIDNHSEKNAAAAEDAAHFADKVLFGFAFLALACLAAFTALIAGSILRSIRSVAVAVEQLNSGEADLTYRVPPLHGEFAPLAVSLNQFISNLEHIVQNINEAAAQISAGSKEIALGNTDLSARTEEQASSLEETASSMEELASAVKTNADNARQANETALSASAIAAKSGDMVTQVVETMDAINASARKIVDIIAVIDGIAFQTNILALNAAVEAARAGEQGRGFAVVASEVRTLAQRSAAAAKDIKTLITESVTKAEAGSRLVADTGVTMEQLVDSVKRVADIMGEITAATGEQSAGIDQVNQAVTQMDEVTQQNAALVEEAAAAAQSLDDQAGRLMQTVSVFKLAKQ
jgi:methyl-accepting chemotaxis protein